MHDLPHSRLAIENTILSALPSAEFDYLVSKMEPVTYRIGTIIGHAGSDVRRCYFPCSGMVSLLAVTEQGKAIEVGYTGYEGVVGLNAVLGKDEMPYQALVQADSDGFNIDVAVVREVFNRRGVFHDTILRYTYVIIRQIAQTGVCNHFHTIQARLCRWLIVMFERSGNERLTLTQEFVSHMLGVQRTSIGMIANAMQAEGIIKYSRGRVEILDAERIRNGACECYFIVNNEQAEYISATHAAKYSADVKPTLPVA